jgi:HipA-like protein
MRSARVRINGVDAGRLEEIPTGYRYSYFQNYLNDPSNPPISLTLPKNKEPVESPTLFAFFFGLLAEGALKTEQCRALKLDEHDHFGRLIQTTADDSIGAITLHPDQP